MITRAAASAAWTRATAAASVTRQRRWRSPLRSRASARPPPPPPPLAQPRVQRGARPRVLVAVVPGVRDANDVGGTHRVQRVLLLGADLIVRRRDALADLWLPADRVAITAERPNAH